MRLALALLVAPSLAFAAAEPRPDVSSHGVAAPVVALGPVALPNPIAPATAKPDPGYLRDTESSSSGSLYAMLGIAALGLGVWIVRRRRGALGPAHSIDVIAQRAVGAKARIVWLAAGGREMIVAITPQQICVLGQWRKQAVGAQPTEQVAHADARAARTAKPEPAIMRATGEAGSVSPGFKRTKPMSAAVAGLLRLRQRAHDAYNPPTEDGDDDETRDASWAKEILSATGDRR